MLKVFAAITLLLGGGGLLYAAGSVSTSGGLPMGPSWFYSRY